MTNLTAGQYQQERLTHWDTVARRSDRWHGWGAFYQHELARHYQFLTPPGLRVLEVGCGLGDLLAAVRPSFGLGIDFSGEMIQRATARHAHLHFIQADALNLPLNTPFDVILLSDLVNDVWDVQALLEQLRSLTHLRTRLILNVYSRVWELPLHVAQRLNLSRPNLEQNWLTVEDIDNLLRLTGFETIRHTSEFLLPLNLTLLARFANRCLVKLWPFSYAALTNFVIARPAVGLSQPAAPAEAPSVSVIVPARNEAGNIQRLFERTPELGRGTEIIFVEGHSRDETYATIAATIAAHPERGCKLFKQTGQGKGNAVREGFAQASGDILMILDADLTVPPEDLARFYRALISGHGEFVNGVRLTYPFEQQAMRFLNLAGNKFFSLVFSWLLGQPLKDTLCGTKVLWRRDYELIAAQRAYFGDFDPFGDFDLLFGAAKLNLKIVDLPIRYRARTYGTTNIDRWRHGWLLLRMALFAAYRIKFI
jgi:SAM-dependent methyltransferase